MVAERSSTATTTSSGSGFPIGAWTTYTSQNEPSDSLYGVLGVPRDASRDEIDNAFLRYRYRDSSGEFETLKPVNMDRVEYAYTVLSNPHKRDLYNQFGEETLRMIEHRYPLVAADWLGLHIAALMSTAITCLLLFLIVVQVLVIGLKLDNTITSSWAVTFVPLWILWITMALTVIGFGYFKYQRPPPPPHHQPSPSIAAAATPSDEVKKIALKSAETTKRFDGLYILVLVVAFAIATVLVALAAENNGTVPLWVPSVVCAVAEAAFIVKSIFVMNPDELQKEFAGRGVENIRPVLLHILFVLGLFRGALWFTSWVLLSLRLASVFSCDYILTFIPAFLSLCLNVVSAAAFGTVMETAVAEGKSSVLPVAQHTLWHGTGCLCVATSITLVTLRFDSIIHVAFTVCIVPVLLFVFALLCVCLYATVKAATMTVDAPAVEHDEFAVVAPRAKPSV